MIIIDSSLKVKILKHIDIKGPKVIVIVSNLTNKEVASFTRLTESEHSYLFTIPLLDEGEYTYKLLCNNSVIETGLIRYGNYTVTNKKEYEIENKVYTYERQ